MKLAYLFGSILLAIPAMASAQDVMQPKYPPGFDCATVPAGSQREECRQLELSPAIDNDRAKEQAPASGAIQTPGTISPPTVPNEPGGENAGPGTAGTPGGIGN
jgi:hypothetical protein